MGRHTSGKAILVSALGIFVLGGCASTQTQVTEKPLVQEQQVQKESGQMMYAVSPTKIRETRDKEAKVVGKLTGGQKVKAAFFQDDWYAVFNPDATDISEEKALGYVSADRLKAVSDESDEVKVKSAVSKANIREKRSKVSKVVGRLKAGDKVKAAFLKEGWYAVFNLDETDFSEENALGYVFAPLLKDAPAEAQ